VTHYKIKSNQRFRNSLRPYRVKLRTEHFLRLVCFLYENVFFCKEFLQMVFRNTVFSKLWYQGKNEEGFISVCFCSIVSKFLKIDLKMKTKPCYENDLQDKKTLSCREHGEFWKQLLYILLCIER
jgi:hypothetical protein